MTRAPVNIMQPSPSWTLTTPPNENRQPGQLGQHTGSQCVLGRQLYSCGIVQANVRKTKDKFPFHSTLTFETRNYFAVFI